MRTEEEMFELILSVAKSDRRIRAVWLNGSKASPHAKKDRFQDYDIVYVVKSLNEFIENTNWLHVFGERIIMQKPDAMSMFSVREDRYAFLMLFKDGNRIDLTLVPQSLKKEILLEEKMTKVLLDKDYDLPQLEAPTDSDFWIKKPSESFYDNCCNEFWWVTTYVAKGICRNDILYAQAHLNQVIRPMLLQMISWRVGIITQFSVSDGKFYNRIPDYLSEVDQEQLLKTYPSGMTEEIWQSLFIAIELFRKFAREVGQQLGYQYPESDDKKVHGYLESLYKS
ncbi:aminoglycoside 6-adenylyltransferase [Alkalihalobacillus trypoxylicola]|uniref:Aminoglycoside adenylyltransferase n=1 Tax=Alkalihalobacillus trypoxylicola TaxID=519424 RepID=A0A162D175_9BACI|nr:aminoglycoside 6-adenylyltransferase [Alkalihalobacillus trypoxylicola]KYG27678.1 aminoglycoside adenylyltransferase [Alkalihalobacillus trypoxylicola]